MSTSDGLRVFISSTFQDLQEEREHLMKKIFPEMIRSEVPPVSRAVSRAWRLLYRSRSSLGHYRSRIRAGGVICVCLDKDGKDTMKRIRDATAASESESTQT